jgi:hypothetical protein
MSPWTFDIKFHRGTQFTFRSLTFAAGEDEDLKMLSPWPALEHLAMAPSSTSGGSCSGLNPCTYLYIRTAKLVWGIPIVTSIIQPLAGASSSSSSASTSIKIHLMTTMRSGPATVGSSQKAVASSLWRPRTGIVCTKPPAGIPPLRDRRHLMPEHQALAWSGT